MEGPTILFLVGLALTCGVLLFRTHRQLLRQPKSAFPAPPTARARRLDTPPDARHADVEPRDPPGQLDGEIAVLRQLVQDARRQAERLESALARAAQRSPPPCEAAKPPLVERLRAGVDRTTVKPTGPAGCRHNEIYSLADGGLSSAAIASRLGSPIGEVELILGLRQNGPA